MGAGLHHLPLSEEERSAFLTGMASAVQDDPAPSLPGHGAGWPVSCAKTPSGVGIMPPPDRSVSEWPEPPGPEAVDRVERHRRQEQEGLIERAGLSPAQRERLARIFQEMNWRIEEAFDRTVGRPIRERQPVPDQARADFLTAFG